MRFDIISKKFLRFLKTEQAYISYVKNSEKNAFCGLGNFYEFIKDCDEEFFIDYAFRWSDTVEGFDYWSNLHHKWCDLLKVHKYHFHKPIH